MAQRQLTVATVPAQRGASADTGTPLAAWRRARAGAPPFAPLAPLLRRLPARRLPAVDDLNRLLPHAPVAVNGRPLHFVTQSGAPVSAGALAYERHIHDTGAVPTRAGSLHDIFNALVWLRYPRAKGALNAAHLAAADARLPDDGADTRHRQRGARRDALTLFDENGLCFVSADPALCELLREHRWKELFWQRRRTFLQTVHCELFGHGLYQKAATPFIGLTAKAWLLDAAALDRLAGTGAQRDFLGAPPARRTALLDALLASAIAGNAPAAPHDLSPLPILGVPGWSPLAEAADFYDDRSYFRPKRSPRPGADR